MDTTPTAPSLDQYGKTPSAHRSSRLYDAVTFHLLILEPYCLFHTLFRIRSLRRSLAEAEGIARQRCISSQSQVKSMRSRMQAQGLYFRLVLKFTVNQTLINSKEVILQSLLFYKVYSPGANSQTVPRNCIEPRSDYNLVFIRQQP